MAGMTDLGGIFYKLGLDPDKNSFETGIKLIDNVGNSLNKLIGTARNASVALLGISIATGQVENASFKTATKLGMTTEALDKWKAAAKIAGVNADGLVSSMGELSYTLNNIRLEGIDKYANSLADLQMGVKELQDANGDWLGTEEAYIRIIEHAQKLYNDTDDPQKRLQIINALQKTIGSTGADFFIDITAHQGKSIRDFLIGAGQTVFTTPKSNKDAADFATEFNTLKTTVESISKLFGSEVAQKLTPAVKDINQFIQDNKTDIINGINTIATGIGSAVQGIGIIVTKLMNWGKSEKGQNFFKGFIGSNKTALETSKNLVEDIWTGNFEKAVDDWMIGANQMIDDIKTMFSVGKPVKDGIIRSDGTVTPVAPDDWIFAVRNVGDLARAFIPQAAAAPAGVNEFIINQTFNINGGSDLPQVLRQQAYQGTQDGLMQIMQQSSNRLQLMSGTR